MNARAIGYWATTAVIVLVWLSGGLSGLVQRGGAVEGIEKVGYPLYFAVILSAWKVLAALALAAPRLPRLKEWAYAGTFFELSGAAISQAMRGDSAGHVIWPASLLVVVVASWALRPQSRTLGVLASTPL